MGNKTVSDVLSDFKDYGCAECVSKYCAENCGRVQQAESEIRAIIKEEGLKVAQSMLK